MLNPNRSGVLLLGLIAIWGICTNPVHAQRLSSAQAAAIDQAVQQEMNRQQVVGAAVGVLRQGRVVYVQAYGQADREADASATTATVFNWASNSKAVIGVLAVQLAAGGVLDLDADVRTSVPEFPDPGEVVTLRQLLSHQSGLPHYHNGKIVPMDGRRPTPRELLDPLASLKRFGRSPLLFKPGQRHEYSSYGFILATAAVQQATEKSIDELLQEQIVRPLGLSSFQLDLPSARADWARGYERKSDGRVVPAAEYAHYWKHGAGGYKSDVRDFAAWAEALLGDDLLTAEMKQTLWTDQATANGKPTGYGLGMYVANEHGKLKVSHNGLQGESCTRLVLYPQEEHGVVVMCNCEFAAPGRISTAVYRALRTSR